MRIDYFHIGSSNTEIFTIDKIYKYGIWAGSTSNLIDELNNGKYYYKIYDHESSKLIYSKGFDTFFQEYVATSAGLEGITRSFHQTALIPFPLKKIRFVIEKRNESNQLLEIFETLVDPQSIYIINENIIDNSVEIFKSVINGHPHNKVDVVILAEGYTANEKQKFVNDLEKFIRFFFEEAPFDLFKNKFNFYGVFKASEESGTDLPGANIFVSTVLNTSFWTLGSERYLMTEDNKKMRDLAAFVPYDAILVQVNHSRYGGGGIYNQYCAYTTDNQFAKYLLIHEFGHSFAGLADEYYTSDVAYSDLHKPTLEPVEPNITAFLEPKNIKWQSLLSAGIEVPTLWEKDEFDKMSYEWLKERNRLNNLIAQLKRERAPESEIKKAEEEYALKDKEQSIKVDSYLKKSKFWNKVGVFEGAGYKSKGLYRSMLDCIMFSKGDKPFCKVCEHAITKVIISYSD
jgi:hypothetical protein